MAETKNNVLTGVLIKAFGGFYFVQQGDHVYSSSLRGRLKMEVKNPEFKAVTGGILVGDYVEFTPLDDETAVVENILPRTNKLIRPKIANATQGLIILAAANPKPDFMLLDRLLILMQNAHVKPIICFNKIDLIKKNHVFWTQKEVYEKAGFKVVLTSALEENPLAEILPELKDEITVVAGPSGAGKSSLLNTLQDFALETGTVSHKLQRGKHTTRAVELMPLEIGGWVADSPGFSRLDFTEDVQAKDLKVFYPEFLRVSGDCRFDGCLHRGEPDCAVKSHVAAGEIDQDRYDRYIAFMAEIEEREDNKY